MLKQKINFLKLNTFQRNQKNTNPVYIKKEKTKTPKMIHAHLPYIDIPAKAAEKSPLTPFDKMLMCEYLRLLKNTEHYIISFL